MNEFQTQILIQTASYASVMILSFFIMSIMFRGYFWKYIKVRLSFGKYLMVKLRSTMRDYFTVGWVEDGFLIYKAQDKSIIRIAINSADKVVYRCLAVNWIDIDDEKHCICKVDYSAVDGFDSKKFSDLLTRALMRPTINSTQEKIILICCFITLILAGAAAYLSYLGYANTQTMMQQIPELVSNAVVDAIRSSSATVTNAAI